VLQIRLWKNFLLTLRQYSKSSQITRLFTALIFVLLLILVTLSSSFSFTPQPKIHPLPPALSNWQDKTNSGDYFDQIKPIQVGYFVWSKFPIKWYVELPKIDNRKSQNWLNTVVNTVIEWNSYLPLVLVNKQEDADIVILQQTPPLQKQPGSPPRARSAETRYQIYASDDDLLSHRFSILLSPSLTGEQLKASVRHEFGHALGIWGHSNFVTDALYYSQVPNPQPISPRDINTLKRIYQQPTSFGWRIGKST
jgi:predicted Zn-dependent protease